MARVPSKFSRQSPLSICLLRRVTARQPHATALSAVAGADVGAGVAVVAGRAVWRCVIDTKPTCRERHDVGFVATCVEPYRAVELLAGVVDADAIIPASVVVTTLDGTLGGAAR